MEAGLLTVVCNRTKAENKTLREKDRNEKKKARKYGFFSWQITVILIQCTPIVTHLVLFLRCHIELPVHLYQ